MLATKHVTAVVKAVVVIHNFLRREVGSQYIEIASEIQSCGNTTNVDAACWSFVQFNSKHCPGSFFSLFLFTRRIYFLAR